MSQRQTKSPCIHRGQSLPVPQRIVGVGLGLGEVARRDGAGEDAVLGIVGRGGRRVGADAAAGLLSLSSCRHAQRHIHFDIFTGS